MTQAHDLPFFFVTGFPKSGNKWLQWQLMSFASTGGFHVDPARGIPLLGSALFECAPLLRLLGQEHIAPEAFVRALYNPRAASAINWSDRASRTLHAVRNDLAVQASRLAGVPITPAHFAHVHDVRAAASPHIDTSHWQAIGVSGMHTPIAEVRRLLPSFSIVHLMRDPRDVVVSYFYHYISTLTFPLASKFVICNDATGDISHNPRWKRPFARRVMRALREYYDQRMPEADEQRDRILRVRYEDLLDDGPTQLRRILRFVGCDESDAAIARVVDEHRFENQTGSTEERRDSLVRKGRSGDWRNYFDRELLRAFGPDFIALLIGLGYEPDDAWTNTIPRRAPKSFEFSRFRIQRSTTRQFVHLWEQSAELRERYPNPWAVDDSDSFFHWLCQCDDSRVRDWLTLARQLADLWQVDVVETSHAHQPHRAH